LTDRQSQTGSTENNATLAARMAKTEILESGGGMCPVADDANNRTQ